VDTKKGKPLIGKHFKKDHELVLNALSSLSAEDAIAMDKQLKEAGLVLQYAKVTLTLSFDEAFGLVYFPYI
jgi:hypothetical protein